MGLEGQIRRSADTYELRIRYIMLTFDTDPERSLRAQLNRLKNSRVRFVQQV